MFAHSPPNNFGLGRPPDRTENITRTHNPGNHIKYTIHPTFRPVKSEGDAPDPKVIRPQTREHRIITLPGIPRALLNEPTYQIQKKTKPLRDCPPCQHNTLPWYSSLSSPEQFPPEWCGLVPEARILVGMSSSCCTSYGRHKKINQTCRKKSLLIGNTVVKASSPIHLPEEMLGKSVTLCEYS